MEFSKEILSKAGIADKAKELTGLVNDGELDPLEALMMCQAIGKICGIVRGEILDYAVDQFDSYGERFVEKFGAEITKKEAGAKYDFSGTDAWFNMKKEESAWATERRELEKMLKALRGKSKIEWNGETIEAYPPVKESTTIVNITFK